MTPQALTRIDGTVLAVRTENIDALPAKDDKPARAASTYRVVDLAADHVRYDGQLRPGLTAVLTVTLGDDDLPAIGAGEHVSLLVAPYTTARPTRSGWVRIVGHRFVALAPALAPSRVPVPA
jgi:hypothetical protein